MKIGVCVKAVPDTETRVKLAPGGKAVSMDDVKFVLGPYDEYAMEESLRVRERSGGGEVVAVSCGGDECVKILKDCLAMGADRAVQIKDPSIRTGDPYDVARTLAEVARKEGFQLVLAGKQGVGGDNQQVPSILAELLGWPCAPVVVKMDVGDGSLTAHCEIEGGEEVVECRLPAVASAQKGLNTPRYASLKGIMAAKKKQVETRSLADLGLAPALRPSWETEKVELPPARSTGRVLAGEPEDQVRMLVQLLRAEARVI